MAENGTFALTLERIQNYEFQVKFDWKHLATLNVDEPEPLGNNKGPNASRLLGAAVGNCLSASLLFCLQRFRIDVKNIKTEVTGSLARNEKGRLRVGKLDVHIKLELQDGQYERVRRCLELFEDFCVVTASIRKGIPVSVLVTDPRGNELYHSDH
ncbi:MAG: OsmC family protein [candidate division KSB1 bacterium]|nr:OsmC family protein [candidate division KSB1 bacterium]MDZ7304994.1 OsmC family protein [candidate division KSB1 bacterium]MDZ7314037.1 OsmC family protein [candidate division KSB1 bacterium]